jgi:hypothetical protein
MGRPNWPIEKGENSGIGGTTHIGHQVDIIHGNDSWKEVREGGEGHWAVGTGMEGGTDSVWSFAIGTASGHTSPPNRASNTPNRPLPTLKMLIIVVLCQNK